MSRKGKWNWFRIRLKTTFLKDGNMQILKTFLNGPPFFIETLPYRA